MSDVTEYKCPTCGAPMQFDINKQCMVCKYCTNKYDLDYMRDNLDEVTEEKLSDFDWVERTKYVWEPYELDKMDEVECTSCGGKILMKAFYVSAKCPYCGHNVIISSDLDGDIRPDKVIPFKVSSKEFYDKYMEYISEFKKVPKEFKSKDIQKKIVGFYIPVWKYSCTYKTDKNFDISVNNYPILANDADVSEEVFYSLLPYGFSEAEEFTESCITGFCASKYIIGAENALKSTDAVLKDIYNENINAKTYKKFDEEELDTEEKLDKLLTERLNTNICNRELSYYLVPVWLLKINCEDKEFTFAMNGQTGRMRVDKITKELKPSFPFWLTFLLLHLPIILIAIRRLIKILDLTSDIQYFWIFLLITIIQLLPLALVLLPIDYKIANSIRKKILKKKVYFNSKRYDEQKVWSIRDFIIKTFRQ